MTDTEKEATLDMIAVRIAHCDHHGQTGTANLWRDLYVSVASRPAAQIVCSDIFRASLAEHERAAS